MKPAAFVNDGDSLASSMEELRAFDGKVFATPRAAVFLDDAGVRYQPLGDPLGVARIYSFGHKEIHLFGFDLSGPEGAGQRVCFENRVFFTTPDQATHAQMLMQAVSELLGRGATIGVHGDGMFPHMARCVTRDMGERVLTAVYDMQVSPPTYEFFTFLAEAERYRVARGFTCIDVVFAPGPMHGFRDDGLPPSLAERQSMLHRICVSGARLLQSVRNVYVQTKRTHIDGEVFPPDWTNERPRFHYGPRFQKNGHRCLAATQAARDEINRRFTRPYSTITLREAEYWPARNSNRVAWDRAARWLQREGMPPIVVADTHGRSLPGFENFSAASWDVDLRLALYEGAQLNLGVANGPMALLHLAAEKCPYILFQKPDESSATPQAFIDAQGIKHGEPWSEHGWTQWEDDTPDNVMRVLQDWFWNFVSKEVRMA